MMENLKENGLGEGEIPIVIQFNKRDLPDVRTDEELEQLRQKGSQPIFPAVAIRGEGVIEPLFALLKLTFRNLNSKHDFAGKFGLSEAQFLRNIFSHMNVGEVSPSNQGPGGKNG
jgi:hypothetical protein